MDIIKVAIGDTVRCPFCEVSFTVEDAETALAPVRPRGISYTDSNHLYLPTHAWTGMTSLPCRGSRARITEPRMPGEKEFVLAMEFNPGDVNGVKFSDVMSALDDLDIEVWEEYGTPMKEITNRSEIAERIMKLFAGSSDA